MAERLAHEFKKVLDRNANTVERGENGNRHDTLHILHRRDHDNCSPTLDSDEVNGENSEALVPFGGQATSPTDKNATACHVFQHRNIVALNQFQVRQNENNSTEAAAKTKVQGDANQTFSNLNAENININFGKAVQEAGDIKQYACKAVQTTAKDFGRGFPNAIFNDLCFKVIEYIDGQDNIVLRKLKMLCMVESDDPDDFGIPMDKFEDLKNGMQFVMCLRKCQLFSPKNILYLQYLLHKIEADSDIVDAVTTYGKSCKHNPLRMFTQKESSAQGVVSIKFHLKGQLSKFTQMKADEFRGIVSEKLGIPNYLITITGIDEGSIIITLQIPKHWNGVDVVDRLRQQIHAAENWIHSNNILDVEILGKSYKPPSVLCPSDKVLLSAGHHKKIRIADSHRTQKTPVPPEDHNVGVGKEPSPLKCQSLGIGRNVDDALAEYQHGRKALSQNDQDNPDGRSFEQRVSYDSGLDPDSPLPASPNVFSACVLNYFELN